MTEKRQRRRNCADRVRAELQIRRIHRRKRIDPAFAMAIQLFAFISLMINLFPQLPEFQSAVAAPLPEPPRPVSVPVKSPEPRMYKRAPSWPLLMRDLARPVAHDQARAEVYARLPVECRPWLDQVFRDADWSAIRPYARSGASDKEVSVGALGALRMWKADQEEKARKAKKDTAGGHAGTGAKPSAGGDDRDDDNDGPSGAGL